MKHIVVRPFIALLVLCLYVGWTDLRAQNPTSTPDLFIKTEINSGDPACPFPQFLEYKRGRTLAKHNAEGVTHADMEKAMREAYEIMTHRCRYYGEHCGVKYITFNQTKLSASSKSYPEVPSNWGHFCTEGDGYILLAAAIFADQKTYNGLYMWVHDNRMSNVKRFQDGRMLRPGYRYGKHIPGWENDETTPNGDGMNDGATDGDVDIAMAAYIAYKQWGEYMMQDGKVVKDADGNPISLREEARAAIKSLVDTFWVPFQEGITYNPDGTRTGMGFSSGDVGFDGYVKGGCTWGEVTNWAANNAQSRWPWMTGVATGGQMQNHIDYNSVAYFNEFWKWLEDQSEEGGKGNEWEINQMKRAQASSEWLNEQAYKQGYIPSIGWVGMQTDGNPTFSSFSDGEDFRYAWRHLIHYMWHGDTDLGWNPKTHEVTEPAGGDDYNYLMAGRMADIFLNPCDAQGKAICGPLGASPDPGQHPYFGLAHLNQCYDLTGKPMTPHHTNYTLGAASSAAVIMGDKYPDLVADVYRFCELKWDDASYISRFADKSYRYENSTPSYFHGWFRTLGMITTSGNLIAPSEMYPRANVKVYMAVDKTYAYEDDNVTYTIDYRNYGSKDAENVSITMDLDSDYELVSVSNGGKLSGKTLTWNVGKIPGFKSGHLEDTKGSVTFTVRVVSSENPRVCLTSTISGDNFEDWVSNEYPNNASYTMERNCVDILKNRSLTVAKTANRDKMNPKDIVKFTVEFENLSGGEDSWLNGGRKYVGITYGNYLPNGLNDEGDWTNTTFYQYYRFWNEAQEAYINMGNYRVSYFMNDINKGFKSADNPNGWLFGLDNENDVEKYGYFPASGGADILYQKIPPGSDSYGAWNQRFVIKFPDVLTTASSYIFDKLDGEQYMHKGVVGPGLYRSALLTQPATNMKFKVEDDWSYSPELQNVAHTVDMGTYTTGSDPLSGQSDQFIPITPCYADYNYPDGIPITNYDRFSCAKDLKGYDRVLVEEFDGYTWRRVLGRGPLPGKEAYDVVVVDTLPAELEWKGFVDSLGLGVKARFISPAQSNTPSGVVYWTIPEMLVGEKDKLVYEAVARDMGCPDADDVWFKNVAWISSKTDSPDSSQVDLMITCAELPPIIEPQTSLFKTASKKRVEADDPLSYSLKFINTLGTVIEGNLKSSSDWVALGGGKVPVASGVFSCDPNKNQGVGAPYFFTNSRSYGQDVVLETTWDITNSSEFYFVFRQSSGTPYANGFKGVCLKVSPIPAGDGTIKFEVLDGSKVIATEKHNVACPARADGKFSPTEFRVELKGETMYIYVNDMETVLKSYSGITTLTPGYVGIYSGPQGNQNAMTRFYTEVDYAFDITLFDDLPIELGSVSNISDGGTYDASKHRITWPTVATETTSALAPGDSIVYTFDTEVDNCGKYITNMGLATVYGQDTLKVLNTIQCGVEECELNKAEVQFVDDMDKICEGDSVLLVGYGDDGKDGSRFLYEFFLNGVSMGKASYKGNIYVNKAGSYHVKVSSPVDPTCSLESNKVTLTVNERPVGQDFPLGTLCVGTDPSDNAKYAEMMTAIDGRPAGVNYNWVGDNGGVPIVFPSVSTDAVGNFDKPYFLNTEDGCVSDTFHLTYTVADTAVVKLSDLTICSGQSGTLTAGTDMTYTYLWSDGSTLNELVTDQPGKYSVVVTTPDGCESKASAIITVADELKVDLGADTTICDVNLPLVLDASSSYDTYEWTDGSTLSTLSVTESGEYEVKVTQGSCSGSGKINVTVSPTPVLKGTFKVTYLVNDTTAAGVFDKSLTAYDATVLEKESGIDYTWYDENQNELSSEPIPDVPAGGGNGTAIYYVKAKNAEGCESQLQKVTVQISGSPMPTATDVAYCLNATDVKPLEATPGDNGSATNWTLRWYDAAGNQLNDAPVPDVTVAGETNYYVSQVDEQGTEGGKAVVTVSVYDLPQIKAEPQSIKLCNTPYALNAAFRETNGLSVTYSYYDANKDLLPDPDPMAEKSGVYYAKASYAPVTDLLCESADYASVDVVIDKITDIKVVASQSICPLGETELVASATSEGSALSFSWSGDATGNDASLKMKDETGEYGKVYSYKLQMTAGLCVFDTTLTVTVGRGVLTGALTANGVETKEYRTCGDEDIELSATHEGTDFKWTTYDGDLLASDISTTVRPTQTKTYILSFVNECETSDTIVVEIYPFSMSTEFSNLDTAVCEGASASGHLSLNGYSENMSGSYIKWFRNGEELPEYAGLSTLEIPAVTAQDGGEYTFEASNGICLAKSLDGVTSAQLTVKPFVSFATPNEVVTANGASATLELSDLVPSNATVVWKGSVNEGMGNPFQIDQVFADELFEVSVTADGYCERDAQLQLVVDAKVIVSASTTTSKICLNDAASVVADTTGTGHLLHPEKYSVVWYACDESGNCESLQLKGLDLTHYPESNISYFAVVTYGEQVAYSDTIPVTVLPQVSYSTSTDVVSCSGEEVTLSVEIKDASDAVVTWMDGTEGKTLTVNPTEATKYGFTITQDGLCPQTDSIPVAVRENPSVQMEDNIVVCSGNGINFDPKVSGDDIDMYHWINPDGDTIAHTQKLSIKTEPVSGTYTFVAVSQFCGEAVGTQKVDIAALPELLIDSLSINSRKLVPVGRAGQFEFKVDNNDWSTQDVYENLTYDYPHTALVRDELGCEGMTVFVVTAPPIAIPDYFTPSEDGLNDTWDLSTIMDAYPNTKVTIYDRTGKVVAVLEGDVTDWDGTYNGYPLPSTDYWYLINVPEIRRQFTGHFTLIRTK